MSRVNTLTRPAEGMKLAISSAKDAHYVPGRRQFFQYRDLGVTEATGGKMRAQGRPQNRPWIVRPDGTTTPATCSSSIFSAVGSISNSPVAKKRGSVSATV